MDKLLSIVIPSYNMERYLERCINSLLIEGDLLSKLDIIIVNDGSKDNTLEIANSFANIYPKSITIIDKKNGHYGSCINAALKIAKGKYFRILDADDWFDKDALTSFVKCISEVDVDAIVTKYAINSPDGQTIVDASAPFYNKIVDLNETSLGRILFQMHQLTYRTELLRSINYNQSEGICYTDSEYVIYPLMSVKTMIYFDITLYQYYLGREDQSMDKSVRYKNRNNYHIILNRLFKYDLPTSQNSNSEILLARMAYSLLINLLLISFLIEFPSEEEELKLKGYLHTLKNKFPKEYKEILKFKISRVPIFKLWERSGFAFKSYMKLVYLKNRIAK